MKKLFLFIAAIFTATVFNLNAADVDTLYLNTGGSTLWNQAGAKFSIWYWNDGEAGKFTDFLELAYGETDIYRAIIPKTDSVIFVRHAATAEVPTWDNKLHQTKSDEVDLEIGNIMVITSWDPADREWDWYTPKAGPVDPIKYLAPVYNTTGDPKSGILRWDTLSCTEYTVVENCTTAVAWNAGWYVVKGTSVEIKRAITCSGAVHLILADGAQLTALKGINVSEDANSITIYGQSNQTGTLIATGGLRAAGIGGSGRYSSNITINGGKVTATGGKYAAGIGGGNGHVTNITINGGTVTATGGESSAGIGGGGNASSGKNITINGGKVTATGGENGAGIGGGYGSSGSEITINGGEVTAIAGSSAAGIGGGSLGYGSYITIKGGTVTATGSGAGAGIGNGDGCQTAASNIFVNPSLILKADGTNPPTTVIAHATITTDVASLLAGKRYATVETPAEPDMHDFLHFVGLNGNDTVRLNKYAINAKNLPNLTATFEYSKDRINWTAYDTWATSADPTNTYQGAAIALNQGDTVFFRAGGVNGKNATMSSGSSAYFNFAFGADDSIAAGGNTMSLYDATCEQDTMTAYGFYRLFKDAKQLVSAPKLPAKKMADYSYNTMFQSCTSLVTAPKLPATTLNNSCYMGMFSFCSSLTQAPELPATTLAETCYSNMFQNCTSLTQAPELKATKMAERCYASMFDGCTSLIVAPELKAESLANFCYYKMFNGCTSLEVDTCADGSCDGVKFNPTTVGTEPASWSAKMFDGCKGTIIRPQLGGHYCIKEYKEPDMHDMLYFTSLKDNGTVRLNKYGGTDLAKLTATFEYSKDRKTWTEYTWGGTDNKKGAAITLANAGDTIFFRAKGTNGKNATMSYNEVTYFLFAFNTGDSIAAGGNVMSLYDAECKQDTMTAYGFSNLFKDCAKKLVSVSELKLPVTKLAKGCYYGMFYNCLKITDVPALPVTTLAPSCYVFMFYRCTSLTVAPVLPATTLADNCYSNMFSGCTALTQAPELNATVLASKCYNLMFAGCSSLTVAPELKATALVDSCYKQMFKGCTNLEVDTCTGSCDGVKFNPTTSGDAPINWNLNMFDGCKGDAKYTAEHGIQLGGHYCIKEYKEPDMHDMLYFTSLKDNGTVKLNKHGKYVSGLTATFEYSKDRKTWTEYTWATEDNPKYVYQGAAIALAKGDTVFFRAKGVKGKNATMTNGDGHFRFAFGANDSIAAGGNVMSLYDATCEQDTMTAYGFMNLFMDAKQLVSAPKLTASKLAHGCYSNMFFDCSALAQAPELPNTTLAKYCYSMMFHGCSALTAAPALPATVLEEDCYNGMFGGCTALTKAPELKATTLAPTCYYAMFNGCTSLEVDTCTGNCDGAELIVPNLASAPSSWNTIMFQGCKGAYANNIQLGGHYCIKEYVPIQIVVVYNLQGHGEAIKNDTIISGNKLTQPAKPTAQGYEFRDWYTDAQSMGEKFDFSKTITATQDTVITLYAKWRDPAAWEQFQKDLNKYSYVEYDSTYTIGFRVHLATTENAQVQEVTAFPIMPLMGNPFIEVSADVLANYDLQTLETTIISLRPALTDEIKKCMGTEETTENVMLKLIASYTQLPYRVSGLYAVGMLFSSYVDLAYKTWVETNYDNDTEVCKCMLNSDYFFKASAKCIEALQAGEK